MQPRQLLLTAATAGILSMAALSAYAATMSAKDFVHDASIANEFEIQSSKLALEKSQNNEVKDFAGRMIEEHGKTGEALKKTLAEMGSPLTPEQKLDNKHQNIMTKLESLSTDSFNHEYIKVQTGAHKDAVKLFSDFSKNGDDEILRAFAADTLPALESHLKHVEKLRE